MKRNKKYIREYRKNLSNLEHPPEEIIKKHTKLDEEEIEAMEELYGFRPHGCSARYSELNFWSPVVNKVPFPNPYERENIGGFY